MELVREDDKDRFVEAILAALDPALRSLGSVTRRPKAIFGLVEARVEQDAAESCVSGVSHLPPLGT